MTPPPSRAIVAPLIGLTRTPFIETSPSIAFNVPGRADPAPCAAAMAMEKIDIAGMAFNLSLQSILRLQLQFKPLPWIRPSNPGRVLIAEKRVGQRENPA